VRDAEIRRLRAALADVPKPRYSLEELLAKCDFSAPASEEDKQWDAAESVGCSGQDKHDKLFNDWRAAEDAASRLGAKWKKAEAALAESIEQGHLKSNEIGELQSEIVSLRAVLVEAEQTALERAERAEAALAIALSKTNFYAAENDQLTDRALRAEQALQDMKIKLTQSEQAVSARGKSFVALLDERNRAEAELATVRAALAEAVEQGHLKLNKIGELQGDIVSLSAALAKAEREKLDSANSVTLLRIDLDESEREGIDEITQLRAALAEAERERDEARRERDDERDNARYDAEVSEAVHQKLRDLRVEDDERLNRFIARADAERDRAERAEAALAEAEQAIQRLTVRVNELRTEAADSRERFAEAELERDFHLNKGRLYRCCW
jgi:chromosome segregation ATPase